MLFRSTLLTYAGGALALWGVVAFAMAFAGERDGGGMKQGLTYAIAGVLVAGAGVGFGALIPG